MAMTHEPGGQPAHLAALLPGGEPVESLLRKAQFFTPGYSVGGLPRAAPAGRARGRGVLPGAMAA